MPRPASTASASNLRPLVYLLASALASAACSSDEGISGGNAAVAVALGDDWYGTNLGGSVALDGTSSFDGTTLTVAGGGGDFWDSQDDGHFAYQHISGDFDFTARVVDYSGDTSGRYAKAALLFKAALPDDGGEPSAIAPGVYQSLNYGSSDYWYLRAGTWISQANAADLNAEGQGAFLRLTRTGDVFRSYHYADGVGWVQHGGDRIVTIAADGYIGVGATSTTGSLMTVTFTDLSLAGPVPDTTAPAISDVAIAPAGTSATVTWTTDEPASSIVDYGSTAAYGSTASASGMTTQHQVTLTGLAEATTYYLRVTSTDVAGNEAVGGGLSFDTGVLPPTALPAGWSSVELGNSVGGDATFVGGVFSVTGGGGDFWGNQDDGHYAYTPVSGDFELIARVDGYDGDTSYAYAKGALIFKADTGAGTPSATAPSIVQSLNYSSADYWYQRAGTWISAYDSATLNTTGGGAFLRLTRTGDVFRSYHWQDGSGWVQHGGDRVAALSADGYVGLGATSGTSGSLLTVRFSDVSVTGGGAPDPDPDPTPDTIAPVISGVSVTQTDTTATISWATDEAATGVVDYGLTLGYGDQQTATTLALGQSVVLTGLTPATTYYYRVSATDEAGNEATGDSGSFVTLAPGTGALISDVAVTEIGMHSARVSWTTDVPTTTEIDYDLNGWPKDVRDFSLSTSHSVVIDHLMAGDAHTYVITAVDALGEETVSAQRSFDTVAYADDALPTGWANMDIGAVSSSLPGSASYDATADGGSFVVRGTGTDVYNSSDSFHFVHYPVDGDFVLTLRVAGYAGYLHQWSKAMTMFRADLDQDAQMFTQSINYEGNDWLYYRRDKGADHTEVTNSQLHSATGAALYARLTRVGNTFWEEYSQDGVTWTYHGPATGTTVAELPTAGYVGFGVCSKSNDYLTEIVYSDVTIDTDGGDPAPDPGPDPEPDPDPTPVPGDLPAGWYGINLGGSEAAGGSSSYADGVFSVTGGGGDLWGSRDDGHFVYQPVTGDFELIAQVDGYAGDTSYAYAKGALMFKADLGSGVPSDIAPGVYQSLNYSSLDYWYDRVATWIGGTSATSLNTTGGGALLRMTRTGDVFRTYHWEGGAWVQHGADRTLSMPSNGFVGIAATSGNAGLLTVSFSSVSVN